MTKANTNKKEIVIGILILLCGAALTATSFCVYYLVKPQNIAWLVVLCVVDFLYNIFTACMLFKINYSDKWLLKGFLSSAIYTVAFIAIATLLTVVGGTLEFLKHHILGIVFYAFFTGPSILLIVLVIMLLCVAYGSHSTL